MKYTIMPIPLSMPSMMEGGKIIKYGKMTEREKRHDTIPAMLQIGEIIIPRSLANKTSFIKDLVKYGYDKRLGRFKN